MIVFWAACAVLIAVALRFILPPLSRGGPLAKADGVNEANLAIYREQLATMVSDLSSGTVGRNQFDLDREELERRLLADLSRPRVGLSRQRTRDSYKLRVGLAAIVPLLSVAIYISLGNPNALSQTAPTPLAGPPTGMTSGRIQQNVEALARRLVQNPDDADGWLMLARSYLTLEKYREASDAFEKVKTMVNNDPDLLADYAFAVSAANDSRALGRASELIQQALQLDQENPKALALAGNLAFEERDYRRAIVYWQRLAHVVTPRSEIMQTLAQRIQEAKTLADMNALDRAK